jgi:FixJ family two-component response regulator
MARDKKVNIYLVDDDEAVRHALITLLATSGYSARGFDSAESFLGTADLSKSAVLLLDQRMDGMSGLELQNALRIRGADMPIIFITGHGDIPMSVIAMRSGAVTVLEKPFNNRQLIESIEEAFAVVKKNKPVRQLQTSIRGRFETLSPREQDVMKYVVQGVSNRAIAEMMGLSYRTVEVHRSRVMKKMRASTLPELVLMAPACRLNPPETARGAHRPKRDLHHQITGNGTDNLAWSTAVNGKICSK